MGIGHPALRVVPKHVQLHCAPRRSNSCLKGHGQSAVPTCCDDDPNVNSDPLVGAEVNWALCILGIAIISGFTLNQGTTTVNTVLLSNAYGVAVLAVMVRCPRTNLSL